MRHFIILLISFFIASVHATELELVWETPAVFDLPESVVYDEKRDVFYVSNIHTDGFKKLGNGYISIIRPDGSFVQQHWVLGLNAPKGLALHGDTLYVTDINQLVSIDVASGSIIKKYTAHDAAHLNDVAVDAKGRVYVADTLTDSIYKLNEIDLFFRWLSSPALEAPNGVHIEGDDLIIGSWGHPVDGFDTHTAGHLKKVSTLSKQISALGSGQAVGNLDGVEADGNGAYFVTDWINGGLLLIDDKGHAELLVDLPSGAADHEVVLAKKLIIIPLMKDNKLVAYRIK